MDIRKKKSCIHDDERRWKSNFGILRFREEMIASSSHLLGISNRQNAIRLWWWLQVPPDLKPRFPSIKTIQHSVWKSPKMSHSTLRARRATFTFWVDKSSLKMPKMANFGEFLKMRHFWWFSNTVSGLFLSGRQRDSCLLSTDSKRPGLRKKISQCLKIPKKV